MPSYTIAALPIPEAELRHFYNQAKTALSPLAFWNDLDLIFEVALSHRDRFPGVNIQGAQSPAAYLERWVKGYYDALQNKPSQRTANPKSACTDPAIRVIVQATQGLSDEEAILGELNHNLFMSAENIQGNLLEEYIAREARPYGFIWCEGNVLRAIDFCNSNGSFFLQIKNKSNTENSSSSNIREGTDIEKWFRIGTRTAGGVKIPDYKWEALNELINRHKSDGVDCPACAMSEDRYQAFLSDIAATNRALITNR